MIYNKKIKELFKKAKTMDGMSLGECYDEYERLEKKAKLLVKERIHGCRKGLPDELNYMHSFRVYEIVRKLHHWDDPDFELFLAALLHDIVEDGNTSFEELVEMGFPDRTIELVYLYTHDGRIKNSTERWTLMIANLIKAKDERAWIIKLADLSDNLGQSKGLSEEKRKFMIKVKASLLLCLTEWLDVYSLRYRAYLKNTIQNL